MTKPLQYITIILFALASVLFGLRSYGQIDTSWMKKTSDTSAKYWYYMWSLNTAHRDAWGENTMYSGHRPSRAELLREVASLFNKKDRDIRFIHIDYLRQFPSEYEYWLWKNNFSSTMEAYKNYLNSHQ